MRVVKKKPRYPENIYLKGVIAVSGRTVKDLAESIGYTRAIVSDTVNGHYKGSNIVPLLKKELKVNEKEL